MSKSQTYKLKIIYFFKYFADAIFSAYFASYFLTIFDSDSIEYGLLLGAIPITALFANLFWGYISSKPSKNLVQMRLIVILECIAMATVFINKEFGFMLFFVIFFSLFSSPSFNLQDCLAMNYSKIEKTSFQKIMFYGQSGGIVAGFVGSGLLALTNNDYIFIFICAILLNILCFVLWLFVKPIPDALFINEIKEEKVNISFKEVLKYKKYIIYLIVYLLVAGINYVGNQYEAARAALNGIVDTNYFTIKAVGGLVLLGVFYLTLKFSMLKRYYSIILLSLVILALRTFIYAFSYSNVMLILGIILSYVGWGIFIAMHLTFLSKLLPIHLITKGVSLMMPCYYIICGIMTLIAPEIYSKIGLHSFYLILFLIQLIGCLILLFNKKNIEVEMLKNDDVIAENIE